MRKFRFREFKVYKGAIKFRMEIKILASKYFPASENYQLTDQIIRAANSIVLNIAEGADRGTDKDFALFLNRSHTSVHLNFLIEAESLANQITAFRRKLLNDPSK